MGFIDSPTAIKSPWQNPYCERIIGTIRSELLDHVIVINQRQLMQLLKEYFSYYHEDRTHLGLSKDTPNCRMSTKASDINGKVISIPRVGGLHHRYEHQQEAA